MATRVKNQEQKLANGMTFAIKNGALVIIMPLETPRPSKTGATMVVASTRGNVSTGLYHGKSEIKVGLNAYFKED